MNELFGLSMTTIMLVLVALFAVAIASVAFIFFSNRLMFRMGLRNLPRRGMQTGLVVLGLMLSTLIITAAFTTGDTIDHSITKAGYDHLQRTDLVLNFNGDGGDNTGKPVYVRESSVGELERRLADDPDVEGILPFLIEPLPAVNVRTSLSEPSISVVGIDPERLTQFGGLRLEGGGQPDLANLHDDEILLSKNAADELDARPGDVLTLTANGQPVEVRVAAIVKDEVATSGYAAFYETTSGGGAMLLSSVQRISGNPNSVNNVAITLRGGVRGSLDNADAAAARVEAIVQGPDGQRLLGAGDRAVEVDTLKKDTIEEAETTGNLFVTFFLVLGLFSIASGIMLIFLIFVMLAAERKPEMGMARAVGAQRSNLVQSFVSEGMAYSVLAGAVGAALGVAAAIGLVVGYLRIAGGFDFLEAHITTRSLVVSYCLGVVLTFLTVVIASARATNVNIVAAIRGLDEDKRRERRRKTNWKWVAIGLPSMIVPPLGVWLLLRKGFGIAWAWIIAPLGLAAGALALLGAKSVESEFLAGFGFSVLPLCAAMLAAHYRVNGRAIWTAVGLYLTTYWLSPYDFGEKILGTELNGDIEMFVLSGVMVVIALTLIIVFNARLLTTLFTRKGKNARAYTVPAITGAAALALVVAGIASGDRWDGIGEVAYLVAAIFALAAALSFASVRFPRIAPAMKMGVAYPLSNRFRTGMTVAMFSLIIFSLTVFSIINANFSAMITGGDSDGGWDIVAESNRNNPVDDLPAALAGTGSPRGGDIAYAGRTTTYTGSQQVMQEGVNEDWENYPTLAADDAFLQMPDTKLIARADAYASDARALEAVRTQENLALLDWTAAGQGFQDAYTWMADFDIEDDKFTPFQIEVRDPSTSKTATYTVVGVLSVKLTDAVVGGIYVSPETYERTFGEPSFERTYLRMDGGVDAKDAAKGIESALVAQGVQVDAIRTLQDDSAADDKAFTRMFQGFMALGLAVGIAALGVIAFRSVVERRQQIGMLRAIGYQRGTIALTFVLESSFIALMGILSGVVGGAIISRNLFTTGQFAGEGVEFFIPWTELVILVSVAFIVSLFMTWWPSRGAASVPVADALRYE
jgi:putative ABC transport system permease protein